MVEGRDERATGTSNTIYDLSSVLFHALEGGASYDRFVRDAEEADDLELAGFFRRVRDEDGNRASEARRLLAERTLTATRAEGAASGALPWPEPIMEEAPSRAVERETVTTQTPEEDFAPLGDVPPGVSRREASSRAAEETPLVAEEEGGKRENDKGLVDKARDYLLGEGREKDYLRPEDRER